MKVLLRFKEGKWEIRVVQPSVGGVGVLLIGPRRFYYLPPIPSTTTKYPIPKYLLERVTGLSEFTEVKGL